MDFKATWLRANSDLQAKDKGLRRWTQSRTPTKTITLAILTCLVIYGGALCISTAIDYIQHIQHALQIMKELEQDGPAMTVAEELHEELQDPPRTTFTLGLETCEAFRGFASYNPYYKFLGVSGMYNSGTNLLEKLLVLNCRSASPDENMFVKLIPWGKHIPVSWRKWFFAIPDPPTSYTPQWETYWRPFPLPIVMIKDPLSWMASMCRARYDVWFGPRDQEDPTHCPRLVGPDGNAVPARVAYEIPWRRQNNIVVYDSLLEIWNTWYEEWLDIKFPRLMVRFEDLLFHQEEIVKEVCECSGGVMAEEFQAVTSQAKWHGAPTDRKKALERYSDPAARQAGLRERDIEYVSQHVSQRLLEKFNYLVPEPASPPSPT
ncbi:unnamed protein product [Chrysoparadoxa australica]